MRRALAVAFTLVISLYAATAYAIGPPDTIQVNEANCYNGLAQPGDILCVAYYEIDYNTLPTENIDRAFIAYFLTSSTAVNSVAPIVYDGTITATTSPPAQGYGEGVLSFYWSAASVSTTAVVFGGAGQAIKIQGNPAVTFTGAASARETTFNSITWDDSADPSRQLGFDVLGLASLLEVNWTAQSVQLNEIASGRWVLTSEGENYFLLAIPNLEFMASGVLTSRLLSPTTERSTFDRSQASTFENIFDSYSIAAAFTAASDLFGLGSSLLLRSLIWLVIIALIFAKFVQRGAPTQLGFAGSIGVGVPLGFVIGMLPMAFAAFVGLFAVIILVFIYIWQGQ